MAKTAKQYAQEQLGTLDLSHLDNERKVAQNTYNTSNSSLENNAHKLYLEEFFEAFELSGYITPKEKEILKYRFGFYDGKEYTLEEVGQMFGVTRERIRQIQKKALTKVRRDIYLRRFDPKKIDKEYDLRLKRKSKGSSNLKMVL